MHSRAHARVNTRAVLIVLVVVVVFVVFVRADSRVHRPHPSTGGTHVGGDRAREIFQGQVVARFFTVAAGSGL